MGVDIVLSLLLMGPMGAPGIGLATSLSAWINAAILMYMLSKGGLHIYTPGLLLFFKRLALTSVLYAGVLYLLEILAHPWIYGNSFEGITALTLLITAGLASFFMLAHLTNAVKLDVLMRKLRARRT